MKDFFYGIQNLFVNFLFKPYDYLRALELKSWFLSNIISWILILVIASLFVYWLGQLRKFENR